MAITSINNIKNINLISPIRCNQPQYKREKKGDIFIKTSEVKLSVDNITKGDNQYRKDLCKLSKIPNITPEKMQSIMAPDEFIDIIKENSENRTFYVAGERPLGKEHIPDSNGLDNVKMKLFGGNFHIHTQYSDGELSVQNVLDEAASYGDEYIKVSGKPFIVGITDHNSIEGCKEAVKIIASNPEKYKNIKVILGSEISTKEPDINGYILRKPEKYHILTLCINPFEKKLNEFFQNLIEKSNSPMRPKTISIQEAFDGVKHQKQCYFSLAHPAYPDITHRIKDDKDPYETIVETMTHFKDIVGDRGLYAEGYYSSYSGKLATDKKLYDTVIKTCDKLNLYKAGGIDTHGESIFYNGQNI